MFYKGLDLVILKEGIRNIKASGLYYWSDVCAPPELICGDPNPWGDGSADEALGDD